MFTIVTGCEQKLDSEISSFSGLTGDVGFAKLVK
jgi:hypothetical protein